MRQGKSGYDRFPLTTYVHVITRAEADQACRANARIAPEDYLGKVGRPFYRPGSHLQPDDVALQYWFCYYFDDWANIHEAAWESITVFLHRQNSGWIPLGATYSAHENGVRRHWADIERVADTHPWCTWRPDHTPRIFSTSEGKHDRHHPRKAEVQDWIKHRLS